MHRTRVSNQAIASDLIFLYREPADTSMWPALREQLLAQVQNHHLPHHRPEHQLSNTAAGDSGGDDGASDGRKGGKRELSTSKRAAQNRAAQVCGFHTIVIRLREVLGSEIFCGRLFGVTKTAY